MEEMMTYVFGEMQKNASFRVDVAKMINRQTATIRFLTFVAGAAIGYAIYTRKRVEAEEV